MSERRCGTCKWFKNDMYACGDCNYPLPQWLKFAVDHAYRNAYPLEVLGSFTVDENEGKDCPTWHTR